MQNKSFLMHLEDQQINPNCDKHRFDVLIDGKLIGT